MESFGLFEILKNMLPFLGDKVENGKETRSGATPAAPTPPSEETGGSPQNKRNEAGFNATPPDATPQSTSRDAILQFMSSHEIRSKRIKK